MTAPRVSQTDEYVAPLPGITVLGPPHSTPVELNDAAADATSASSSTPAANQRSPVLLLRHRGSVRVTLIWPRIQGSVRPHLVQCRSRSEDTARDADGPHVAGSDANTTPPRRRPG